MRLADAVWAATALLHREHPGAQDFGVQQIVSRVVSENLLGGFRPGLQPHASWHCVANKKPNGGRYRMLYETVRGRRRLTRPDDKCHSDRDGDIRPEKSELPQAYRSLVDWYEDVYTQPGASGYATNESLVPEFSIAGGSRLAPVAFVDSSGAVALPPHLREELELREGTRLGIWREQDRLILQPITQAYISSLRGCCKGRDSLVQAREREHRMEK